jgi:hypothetical protein
VRVIGAVRAVIVAMCTRRIVFQAVRRENAQLSDSARTVTARPEP